MSNKQTITGSVKHVKFELQYDLQLDFKVLLD